MLVTQSCLALCDAMDYGLAALCDAMDYGLPGSSVLVILQARILEWVAIPFSRGSSPARDQTHDSCITDRLFACLSHQFLTVVFPSRFKVRQRKYTRSSPITTQERSCHGQIETTLAVVGPAPLTRGVEIAKCSEGHSGPRLCWGP